MKSSCLTCSFHSLVKETKFLRSNGNFPHQGVRHTYVRCPHQSPFIFLLFSSRFVIRRTDGVYFLQGSERPEEKPLGRRQNLRTRACSRVSRSARVERVDRFHSDEARWLAGMKVSEVSCRARGSPWGFAGRKPLSLTRGL